MSAYELAKKYYPELWGDDRINALLSAGKITFEEYEEIIQNRNGGDKL